MEGGGNPVEWRSSCGKMSAGGEVYGDVKSFYSG